jgi:uncharacterized DUF497 family protein
MSVLTNVLTTLRRRSIMILEFEWDYEKNQKNQRKHGVSFEEATMVFYDPMSYERIDWVHSIAESRWYKIGISGWKVLVVSFTERNRLIRIISARKADKNDKERYLNGYGTICG